MTFFLYCVNTVTMPLYKKQWSYAWNKDAKYHSNQRKNNPVKFCFLTWHLWSNSYSVLMFIIIHVSSVILTMWACSLRRLILTQHWGGKCSLEIVSKCKTPNVNWVSFKGRNWCLEFIKKHSFLPPIWCLSSWWHPRWPQSLSAPSE